LLAGLLLLAGAALGACGSVEPRPPTSHGDPPARAVRTAAVRVGPLQDVVRYVGTVRSHREVTVLAQLSGTIAELPVREGDPVEEGAVVARIVAPETEARRDRARAELQRVRTDSAWLCERYATDGKLRRAGVVPQAQLDQSRSACRGSRASVRAVEAQLAEVDALLERTVERAPFAGQVLVWYGEPGENLQPGRPILLLGDHERELLVRVSESDLRRGVRVGGAALLDLGGGAPVPSRVTWIAPQSTGPARAFDVVVALPPETGGALRHGMSVVVSFVLAEAPDAVAVPSGAVHEGADGAAILLVHDDRIARQAVTTGLRAEGWVAVVPPPSGDARVVVGSLEALADGARVYAVEER
jgi:RND family efflux transporter MFP subunit